MWWLLKKILPENFALEVREWREVARWKQRDFLENAPQFVKEKIFIKYGVPNSQWVETGTFLGDSTDFLSKKFSMVYSVEPSKELYEAALRNFSGRNVELFNGVSEDVFPTLLPKLNGDCNFWLDGHYSAGITFRGDKDCPVEDELRAIEDNVSRFNKVTVLIDDVRCFLHIHDDYAQYPSVDFLVDWARNNGFSWRIEQDIFIMRNWK